MEHYNLVIIGAGVAGISAAKEAYRIGCQSILLIERKSAMGGVLLQCMHRGFGGNLNGPEYTSQLLKDFPAAINCRMHTTVTQIHSNKTLTMSHAETGSERVSFDRLILASGCREIPAGALPIAGTRPEGVYTAGQMQEMMNVYGETPESPVVILGSGDIGLIMANQIAKCGGQAVIVEQKSVCSGMERNRRRIDGYTIPIIYNTTITELHGEKQLCAVTLSNGTVIPCKTLLIAVGLIPNQELLVRIGKPHWLHLCGNCNRVHAMIESVVYEGKKAGIAACEQLGGAKYD